MALNRKQQQQLGDRFPNGLADKISANILQTAAIIRSCQVYDDLEATRRELRQITGSDGKEHTNAPE